MNDALVRDASTITIMASGEPAARPTVFFVGRGDGPLELTGMVHTEADAIAACTTLEHFYIPTQTGTFTYDQMRDMAVYPRAVLPVERCSAETPCCERRNKYNGFASGPKIFTCPKGCACHD